MSALAAEDLYARGLDGDDLFVRREDGELVALPLAQWLGPLAPADYRALEHVKAPVLDVGCGPGRHVSALARSGVLAFGVDAAPAAARHARSRGAHVLVGSIFGRLPGAGAWGSALLLDGNIGIGGRPDALLARLRALLAPGGLVICEVGAPGSETRRELVRLEHADGSHSSWFGWARMAAGDIAAVAARAQLALDDLFCEEERWFAILCSGC
jgi:SAM-dependent methyltransferase